MPCSDTPQSTWLRITDLQKLKSTHGPICFDQPEMNPQWWVGKWENSELAVSKQLFSLSSFCLRSYLSLFFLSSFFSCYLPLILFPLFFKRFSISFSSTYSHLTHCNLNLHLITFFLPPPLSLFFLILLLFSIFLRTHLQPLGKIRTRILYFNELDDDMIDSDVADVKASAPNLLEVQCVHTWVLCYVVMWCVAWYGVWYYGVT